MKPLFLILLLTTLNSCNAQKKTVMLETFDFETYNKRPNKSTGFHYYKDDGTYIELSGDGNPDYIVYETPPPPAYFQTYKEFYPNGHLKKIGLYYPNRFEKGVWREYDEQGNLIKEMDYDAPYKFTWEDVLNIIKEREIDMNHEQFRVLRGSNEKDTSWSIVHGVDNKDILHVINIDGITGEITRETGIDPPQGGEYDDFPEEDE